MSTPEDTTPDDETLRRLDILKRTVNAIVEGKRRADPEKVDRGRQDYERDLVILSEHQPGPLAEQLKREMGEMPGLREFLIESNRIEGLDGTSDQQVRVATTFLDLMVVTITDLAHLADVFTKGGGVLRTKPGMDVVVGDHRPPPGGPRIPEILQVLLDETNEDRVPPYEAHKEYERIHPFTDGNGRTGRLLWLWQMLDRGTNPLKHGFLHIWYYQSLAGEA